MLRIYEPHDFPATHRDEGVTPNIDIIEGVLRLHLHDNGVSFGLVDPSDTRFSALTTYIQARQMMLSEAARVNGANSTPKPARRRTVLCFAGEEHELTPEGQAKPA